MGARTLSILLIDNYDSFTYNLYDYLEQCGAKCTVLRHDAPELEAALTQTWDGIVLSPGPKTPHEAGQLMGLLHHWHLQLPILGICLGHQAIGVYFGATLQKARLPMHGKTSWIHHDNDPLFAAIPNPTEVMRYHSLIISDLADTPLRVIAHTADDATVMAIRHHSLPIVGVQFHPESILTKAGLQLIKNWLQSINEKNNKL